MEIEGRRLRCENLPPGITEDTLKTIFSSRKRRGGGPIEQIQFNGISHTAVITFCEREAIRIILTRGSYVDINGYKVKVYQDESASLKPNSKKPTHIDPTKKYKLKAFKINSDVMSETIHVRKNCSADNLREEGDPGTMKKTYSSKLRQKHTPKYLRSQEGHLTKPEGATSDKQVSSKKRSPEEINKADALYTEETRSVRLEKPLSATEMSDSERGSIEDWSSDSCTETDPRKMRNKHQKIIPLQKGDLSEPGDATFCRHVESKNVTAPLKVKGGSIRMENPLSSTKMSDSDEESFRYMKSDSRKEMHHRKVNKKPNETCPPLSESESSEAEGASSYRQASSQKHSREEINKASASRKKETRSVRMEKQLSTTEMADSDGESFEDSSSDSCTETDPRKFRDEQKNAIPLQKGDLSEPEDATCHRQPESRNFNVTAPLNERSRAIRMEKPSSSAKISDGDDESFKGWKSDSRKELHHRKVNKTTKKMYPPLSESESSEAEGASSYRQLSSKKRSREEINKASASRKEETRSVRMEKPLSATAMSDSDKESTEESSSNSSAEEGSIEEQCLAVKAKRTVKIEIIDVKKPKDFYMYYLEDSTVNDGQFSKKSMLLDGLRRHLFVTFQDPKDAKLLCRMVHGERSNITKVTIASQQDFNWHRNLVAVFGYNFESSNVKRDLKREIVKHLKLDVLEMIQYSERRSLIIKFHPEQCQQVTLSKLVWKCAVKFCGVQLITAPVEKDNTILIDGLWDDIDDDTIERYLSSQRNGGCPDQVIAPIERLDSQKAIATLKSAETLENILNKHKKLEGRKLHIDYFHLCLTTEAFDEHFGTVHISAIPKKSRKDFKAKIIQRTVKDKHINETPVPENEQSAPKDHTKIKTPMQDGERKPQKFKKERKSDKNRQMKVTHKELEAMNKKDQGEEHMSIKTDETIKQEALELKNHEREILKMIDFYKEICVEVESQKDFIILKGSVKNINETKTQIFESLSNFEKILLRDKLINPTVLELLKMSAVQNWINKMFRENNHQAFIQTELDHVILHKFKGANEQELIDLVKEKFHIWEAPMSDILQSKKGFEFIAQLSANDDDEKSAIVKLEHKEDKMQIVALRIHILEVIERLEKFSNENRIHTEELTFSRGEHTFFKRFMLKDHKHFLEEKRIQGITVQLNDDKFLLKGPIDGISEVKTRLCDIREQIEAHTFQLKLFGIKEFLSENEGKTCKDKFEKLHKCLIWEDSVESLFSPKTEKCHSLTSVATTDIASVHLNNCTIYLTHGDVLDVKADGLVNPSIVSQKLGGVLGEEILARGGDNIQEELNSCKMLSGVKITSAGNLRNIKNIFHVVTPTVSNLETTKESMHSCLVEAEKCRIKSIAIPFIVVSRVNKTSKFGTQTALLETIETFLEEEEGGNYLKKIILCAKKIKHIDDAIERCETKWEGKIQRLVQEDVESRSQTPQHSYAKMKDCTEPESRTYGQNKALDIGPIQIKIRKGYITMSKTDAIVITANENLDLSKGTIGKNVLKYGGKSVQDELQTKYNLGIKVGDFAESSAGQLKCRWIMHACLSRYKHDKSELASLVFKLLVRANERKLDSISFPALGTGGLKYPASESASAIQEGIRHFVSKHRNITLRMTEIIIFEKQSELETEKVFKSVFCSGDFYDDTNADVFKMGLASASNHLNSEENIKVTYGSVTFTIKCGDITEERCDGIVNGIKVTMNLSKGAVCKSILSKCGKDFQDECSSKCEEMSQNDVVTTSAGQLPCRGIIHINTDKFAHNLDKGIYKALKAAEQKGWRSIAIPALGAAKSRYANMKAIKDMILEAVKKFGAINRSLTDIRLIVKKKEMISHFLDKGPEDLGGKKPKATNISDSVKLIIICEKTQNYQLLIDEFKQDINKFITSESMQLNLPQNITAEQIRTFQEFGLRHQVKVEVVKGAVYLEGLQSNFKEIIKYVYEKQLALTENKMRVASKNPGIQWEFKSQGKWRKFEPVINVELEAEHTNGPTTTVKDSKGRNYLINFRKNEEYLLDSRGNVTDKSTQIRRCDRTKEEPLPHTWDSMETDETLKLVVLPSRSKEFQSVIRNLQRTNVQFRVLKIERVQNKPLFQQYSVRKREIDLRNPPGFENEKQLYHGTDSSTIDSINQSGFSRNYKSVALYGDGVYFAVDANYSERYSTADPVTNVCQMYQARVLVGESIVTKDGDRALPNKPGKNYPYDSGTDGQGVMYIIFHDAQAYPEYLITFKSSI